MPTRRVSVIISNYNHGRFLKQAIDSVLAQTHREIELVVVDDGSTDDSAQIIESYGQRLKPILKPNRGQGSCFNAGVAASDGDLVMFLDADDYYHPQAVERVVASSAGGAALVQYRLTAVDVQGRPLFAFPGRLDSGDVVPRIVAKGGFQGVVTSGNAFRRDALEKVLPVPEMMYTRAADGYLINTVPFHGHVASIHQPLAYYRLHGDNASTLCRDSKLDLREVRKRLSWTTRELLLVHDQAARHRIPIRPGLPLRCMGHVELRLISCKLAPEEHVFPEDVAWQLGLWGALGALRNDHLTLDRRVLMAGWFALVGAAPPLFAAKLVDLLLARGPASVRPDTGAGEVVPGRAA